MGDIKILPENVANQIAAGEVIERPASIVRELLDNSIDAGADKIDAKIEEGGKGLIRLRDNGRGMDKEDMLMALERHATSKIKEMSDLLFIKTLGFRGEALPSICAVSRLEITSRPGESITGYRLKAAGGKIKSIDEAGAPAGTAVEVKDIYFNTPARRKFLRTEKTETNQIIDTISRVALPFTNVQLRLDSAGKTLLNLPASENELGRLSVLFGRDIAVSLIDTNTEKDGIKIKAYLAPPDFSRSRGDRIYVYVNNRNIRDKLVTRSVMEGYGQRLMSGQYPQMVIFLEIDPSLVDINVHPAKQEVRFHNSRMVYQAVSSSIERALKEQFSPFSDKGYKAPEGMQYNMPVHTKMAEPAWEYLGEENREVTGDNMENRQVNLVKECPPIIGQLKDTYLLFEEKDGLLLVDQHAAHERVVYERLKKNYSSRDIQSQAFLIPMRLEFSLKEKRVLMENLAQMAAVGFDLEHFGGNTFLLRSVPSLLVNVEWKTFLLELIPLLEEEKDLTSGKALDRLMTVMACHGAIRAGQKLNNSEISALWEQLAEMDLPTNCPHGRPIFRRLSYYEIEKIFKRIV
jgi:DNA mismatch repair protein MutL